RCLNNRLATQRTKALAAIRPPQASNSMRAMPLFQYSHTTSKAQAGSSRYMTGNAAKSRRVCSASSSSCGCTELLFLLFKERPLGVLTLSVSDHPCVSRLYKFCPDLAGEQTV